MEFLEMLKSIDIDIENTLYRFGNNKKLLEKFIRKFSEEKTFEDLTNAVRDKNYNEIEACAHTLKGVSANLGFKQLSECCNTVVWDVRKGDYNKVGSDFDNLAAEYQKVIEGINKLSD